MTVEERFMQYVTINTTADPKQKRQPTSPGQRVLAEALVEELRALGMADARLSEEGYVYASIPATPGYENAPALGFVAHMDTAPDANGEGVRPVVHQHYDGGDIHLPNGGCIAAKHFPQLQQYVGHTLITASGDTLLGADDKAGIAEIVTACERLLCGNVPHGRVCVAFTPDEEIGRGTDGFDLAAFGADFAYTVDGGVLEEVDDETFNAAEAVVTFTGVEVHPGEAKDIMVNAAGLAAAFDGLLPGDERPETTSGGQGYYFLAGIEGNVGHAKSTYTIRDFTEDGFAARKQAVQDAAIQMNRQAGKACVTVEIRDQYHNMRAVIDQHPHLIENAMQAIRAVGLVPRRHAVRGGTDGAMLCYKGLPCPNIGTGGLYFHGPNECISVQAMHKAVDIIVNLVGLYARQA